MDCALASLLSEQTCPWLFKGSRDSHLGGKQRLLQTHQEVSGLGAENGCQTNGNSSLGRLLSLTTKPVSMAAQPGSVWRHHSGLAPSVAGKIPVLSSRSPGIFLSCA